MQKNQSYQDRAKSQAGQVAGGGPQDDRVQKVFQQHQERQLSISKENLALAQKNFDYKQKMIDKVQALANAEGTSEEKRRQAQEVLIKLKEKELVLGKAITDETEIQLKMGGGGAGGNAGGSATGGENEAGGSIIKRAVRAFLVNELGQGVRSAGNLVASTFFEGPQNVARKEGALTSSAARATGADLILSGKGAEAAYFQKERTQAVQDAISAQGGITTRGVADVAGSAISGAGAGFAMGGKVGAIAGGVMNAGKSLFSGQSGAYIEGALTSGDTGSAAVGRYRSKVLIDNINANIDANKEKNYRRTKAFEFNEQHRDSFIGAQQNMGLNDSGLYDMLGDESKGLFTMNQTLGAAGAIGSAGGSTAQMRSANDANVLQRDFGLQNAAQLVGQLSGGIGGGKGGTDKVVEKLLADAFSVGLDHSNFSRETEKFVAMSAKFITESGAETIDTQKSVGSLMGNYVTGNSMERIDAAGGAREKIHDATSGKGTSYEKMLQFSKARQLGLGRLDATALMKMSKEQIMSGGFAIEGIKSSTGMTSEQLIEAKEKMGENAFTKDAKQEALFNKSKETTLKAQELMGKGKFATNINDLKEAIENEKDPTKKKVLQDSFDAQSAKGRYDTNYSAGDMGTESERSALTSGQMYYSEKRDTSKMPDVRTTTAFEKAREADAKAEKAQLDNSKEYIRDYADTVKTITTSSKEFILALDQLTAAMASKAGNTEELAIKVIKSANANKGGGVRPASASGSWKN